MFLLSFFFLIFMAVFGVITVSVAIHELQHTDPTKFSNEAMCFDYSGGAFAYTVLNKTSFNATMSNVDEYVGNHYEIYFTQGIATGILVMLILYAVIIMINYVIDLKYPKLELNHNEHDEQNLFLK